jgi:S-formylglutathione hydrolase FrmB
MSGHRCALIWGAITSLIWLCGCSLGMVPPPKLPPSDASPTEAPPAPPRKVAEVSDQLRFVVSFPETVRRSALTGRVLLFLSSRSTPEPRRADYFRLPAVYAIQVTNLYPGDLVTFLPDKFRGTTALAFPESMDRLPAGTYYAQALLDQEQTRADYNAGPDNLHSAVVRCELSGSRGKTYELSADQVIQETPPLDTDWVKFVEVRSRLLSDFHGREFKLRAAVILPSTYHEKPQEKFPALYVIPGFGGRATSALNWVKSPRGLKWQRGEVPLQMFRIVLDPEVPLGHSVFANSANNGPVGDALVRELIPEIEKRFRCVSEARGRFLTGHSSGGWSSLWLQVVYSDLFGGCWSTAPDPVDFRAFQTINIYEDRNGHWTREGFARPVARTRLEPALTFARLDLWEYVTGPGGQLDSFNAVFSPRARDGRPRRLMNALSGVIDREVAEHWKRYDIRRVLQENWNTLGPELSGKLHVLAGDEDTFYLEAAVERLRDFLRTTRHGGYVEMVPGDHSSMMTEELRDRIDREIAERFADRPAGPGKAKP